MSLIAVGEKGNFYLRTNNINIIFYCQAILNLFIQNFQKFKVDFGLVALFHNLDDFRFYSVADVHDVFNLFDALGRQVSEI